jgi:xanthine/CO dehydrogenase XdhC/CoxF family maturation factor
MEFSAPESHVHLGLPALLEFRRARADDEPLVLATVIATEGSTYRKPGAMMLIAGDGAFAGLISGGCLEGDLAQHAQAVFASGEPAQLTYDMSAGDDLVWNLGIGCDGVIHLQLQRLARADGLDVLRQVDASHAKRQPVLLAVSLGDAAGRIAVLDAAGAFAGEPGLRAALEQAAHDWPDWRSRRLADGAGGEVMLIHAPAPVRVLLCGAGPDAVPLARILAELDWEVTIADHRTAFARADRFPPGCRVVQSRPDALGENVDLAAVDAAVIMNHHLENDAACLRQLAQAGPDYIGTLGPRARRGRLQEMAACEEFPVHGPVGLDIGAELPAAIALSVAAEIHAVLNGRDGRPLTELHHG